MNETQGTGLNRMSDRCDACGAQAFVVFERLQRTLPKDGELTGVQDFLFCAHHGTKHGPKLEAEGWTKTLDETHTINEKPSISANAE